MVGIAMMPALGVLQPHQLNAARGFSEDLRVVTSSLTENEYHRVADETMEHMVEKLEAYVEESDVDGGDVEYSQGVLTVKLGDKGTFVVNKQTPNRQIWLSSPVSGPFRFDYEGGRWRYSRDHRDLLLQLQQEIGGLLDRWASEPGASGGGSNGAAAVPASPPLPELRVSLGSEEEVPAARAAIQFAYTGRVEVDSIREALQVRQQAAYLQIEGCAEACLAAVGHLLVAGGDSGSSSGSRSGSGSGSSKPAVLELYCCRQLWPDADEEPAFAAMLKESKPRLVAHFGDALAVLNNEQLYQQMRALPAEGLEALLESNDFGTDSESSVVLVLAEWMEANYNNTNADTRRRLCGLLRLTQCSRAYLCWVLPALAADHERSPDTPAGWFPAKPAEVVCLSTYSTATEKERKAMADMGSSTVFGGVSCWPPGWANTKARRQCLSSNRSFRFSIRQQELEATFRESDRVYPAFDNARASSVFVQGLQLSPYVSWTDRSGPADFFIEFDLPDAIYGQPTPKAGNPRVSAALAGLFGQTTRADCGVVFVLERKSAAAAPAGASTDSDSESEAAPEELDRWASEPGASGGGSNGAAAAAVPATPPLPELRVSLGSEEEVPAARAAIQFAYTGRVEAGSIREALQVRQQAAYLQIEGCAEACLASVGHLLVAGGDIGSSSGSGSSKPAVLELYCCRQLWPDADEEPAFAAVLKESKPRLVAHFGDALAVLNNEQLYQQMRALPMEGLEALLESNDFGTDSESSVVLVLAEWMDKNYCSTDADTRRRLCGLVRLAQCSRTFISWILPILAADHERSPCEPKGWLPLSPAASNTLRNYSTATEVERKIMNGMAPAKLFAAPQHLPSAWFDTTSRRQCLPFWGRSFYFSVCLSGLTRLQLQEELELDLHGTRLGCLFAHGLQWSLELQWEEGSSAAGLFIYPQLPAGLRLGSWSMVADLSHTGVAVFPGLRVSIRRTGLSQNAWQGAFDESDCVRFASGLGWPSCMQLQTGWRSDGVGVAAQWADWLVAGKLTGSVTLLRRP
ncbi:hypothetical protein HYH02_014713 [Chlamydomonas schloesseri]|uniref:ferroxidase n=1 Tax=Chlamydomonas schloesseri TaxID=2026947 RepID=A0A835SUI7_9CHLO|nr:hypothetical protein HYH02_014713 [Chlamydomonas schloesseri]|eukprot:KAG2426860.1 hypothetical protein HYH02_014713 [Chlamydomonas schloesseri]